MWRVNKLTKVKWLPHLPKEVMMDARDNKLCSYTIALEAWRRGLKITFHSRLVKKTKQHLPGFLFTISDDEKSYRFYKARGPQVSKKAVVQGGNKIISKELLDKAGIPVPKGKLFPKEESAEQIIAFAEEVGYPVVLKPLGGDQGKGVIPNIHDEEYLREAIDHVRGKLKYSNLILEKHVTGEEYRIYVLEDEVLAVLNRIPAHIIGDGKHTIKQLIELKNIERKKNPRLYNCLIDIDFEVKNVLKSLGYTPESIPTANEKVFLRTKSNISKGGDSVEMTDEFPQRLKDLAIQTLKAIPEFPHGGVDMMVDFTLPEDRQAHIIELSPTPQIGSLLFPMEGQARDIPAALVDYYFPETKPKSNANPHLYFNFKDVLKPIVNQTAEDVTVIPCPTHIEKQIKFVVSGRVQGVGYRKWIRRRAIQKRLNGYVKNEKNGTVTVAVAGTTEDVDTFKRFCRNGPKKARVKSIEEKIWDGPIKVGFVATGPSKKSVKPKTKQVTKNTSGKKTPTKKRTFLQRVVGKIKRMMKA